MVYNVYRRKVNKIYNVYKLNVKRYPVCCNKKDFSDIVYNLEQLNNEEDNNFSNFFIDYEYENIGYEKFAKKTVEGSAIYPNGMHYAIGDKVFIGNVRYEIIGVGDGILYVDNSNIVKEIGKNESNKLYEEIRNKYEHKEEVKRKESFKDKIMKLFKK